MPTGGAAHGAGNAIEEVSILVLLDDAYRQQPDSPPAVYHILFQSLFFWMMPTGHLKIDKEFDHASFQSLFFWMMPTGSNSSPILSAVYRFQSLFFWMMPTGLMAGL